MPQVMYKVGSDDGASVSGWQRR